jgi:hypothetical protein
MIVPNVTVESGDRKIWTSVSESPAQRFNKCLKLAYVWHEGNLIS